MQLITPRDGIAASVSNTPADSIPDTCVQRAMLLLRHDRRFRRPCFAALRNKDLGITMKLSFCKEHAIFTQWKQMGEGDYVCGLEPEQDIRKAEFLPVKTEGCTC